MSQHLNFRPPAPWRVSGSQRDGLPRERHQIPDAEIAVSKPKGEGASLMVTDLVSADSLVTLREGVGRGRPMSLSTLRSTQRDG